MRAATEDWVSAYLYYAEPWERFLAGAVKPFAESTLRAGIAEQFFFIRYWERGPHIRLRFKGKRTVLEQKLKPELLSYFLQYFYQNPSIRKESPSLNAERWFPNNSIQFIGYEREIARYGGPLGILIAEQQFQASSSTVLSILENATDWDYNLALGSAIQMHLAFAFILGMTSPVLRLFSDYISNEWISKMLAFEHNVTLEKSQERLDRILTAFEGSFAAQQNFLVPFHEKIWKCLVHKIEFEQEWLNHWIIQMKGVASQLKEAHEKGTLILPKAAGLQPETELWPVLESFVHMTNNRLGVLNQDEAYLGYLVRRTIESLHK